VNGDLLHNTGCTANHDLAGAIFSPDHHSDVSSVLNHAGRARMRSVLMRPLGEGVCANRRLHGSQSRMPRDQLGPSLEVQSGCFAPVRNPSEIVHGESAGRFGVQQRAAKPMACCNVFVARRPPV
jgi:hypothetical protein